MPTSVEDEKKSLGKEKISKMEKGGFKYTGANIMQEQGV